MILYENSVRPLGITMWCRRTVVKEMFGTSLLGATDEHLRLRLLPDDSTYKDYNTITHRIHVRHMDSYIYGKIYHTWILWVRHTIPICYCFVVCRGYVDVELCRSHINLNGSLTSLHWADRARGIENLETTRINDQCKSMKGKRCQIWVHMSSFFDVFRSFQVDFAWRIEKEDQWRELLVGYRWVPPWRLNAP